MEAHWKLVWVVVVAMVISMTESAHFRGGTISWKPLGGKKVEFNFKLGWAYNKGPGCTPAKIGKLVKSGVSYYWSCTSGCGTKKRLSTTNYICSGANRKENWEQGERSFTYTFANGGPFKVGYSDGNWISLSNNKGGNSWNIETTVNLGIRSDTGTVNSSPVSLSKPMYYTNFNCDIQLHIPIVDADGDTIRCMWASGKECVSVCNALPGAVLDEKTCTLHFKTLKGYRVNGIYAVALTIRDYPQIPMTQGTVKRTPTDALSAIPLQFLIKTIPTPGPCDDKPQFVPPSPDENDVITAEEGDKVIVDLYADNGNDTTVKIKTIKAAGVLGMTSSPVRPVFNRTNTFISTLTWQTTTKHVGNHLVCGSVTNAEGISGTDRCFTITIVPKGCGSNPCQNGAKCNSNSGNYTCTCRPGFTGINCETNIDDCLPNVCNNGTCVDGINTFTCNCTPGFTGKTCKTDIDDCLPNPCPKGANCTDGINNYTCTCPPGFSGVNCSILDHCIPDPCKNNSLCVDLPTKYFCLCQPGFTGINCDQDIDECAGNPCLNGAKCLNQKAKFTCVCTPGYSGKLCQTGHNYCNPNPCKRGGICINGRLGPSCNCLPGWMGKLCNIIDPRPTPPPAATTTPPPPTTMTVNHSLGVVHVAPNNTTTNLPLSTTRPPNASFASMVHRCPLTDYACECVFQAPRKHGLSQTMRDLLGFFYGFPFGLVLSALTWCLYNYCVTKCIKDGTIYYPRPKPETPRGAHSPDSPPPVYSSRDTDQLFIRNRHRFFQN